MEGLLVPLLGTGLGALCALFLKNKLHPLIQKALTGFAAGVMAAASVWSLIIPSLEQASGMGAWSFIPAVIGFWTGILFLLLLDKTVPHTHIDDTSEGPQSALSRSAMLILAVTIHNRPEGMAVGFVYAGYITGTAGLTAAGAFALALGIAIQNFPEGAIISLPLRAAGMSRRKAVLYGILSGAVEPAAALLTILAARLVVPVMPYLLSFAAGAMMYVVVEELVPEMSEGDHSNVGTVLFAFGFTLMMALDAALG